MKPDTQATWERIFLSRWFLFTLLGITIVIAISYARAYYEDYTVRQEIIRLQGEVNKLEKKKFASLELLQYAQSEHFFDNKARTELNLKKTGEQVLVVPTLTTETNTLNNTKTDIPRVDTEPLSNPHKWWYYFVTHSLPN
jgi:cell division protein FtsL